MLKERIEQLRSLMTKIQPVLLWLISAYYAEKFIRNGIRKFDPEGFWSNAFDRWGYSVEFMVFIGFLETVGGLMLLTPKYRHFGAMIIAPVMCGAITTRLIDEHGTDLGDAMSITFSIVLMLYFISNTNKRMSI